MRPRLLLFCGIPGSGKTTVAAEVARVLPSCVHVQSDVLRLMIAHPDYASDESSFVYAAAVGVAEKALAHGYDAILDATFARRDYRERALALLAPFASYELVVRTECSLELALRRNAMRESPVPQETVVRIHRGFQDPYEALRVATDRRDPLAAAREIVEVLQRRNGGS